MQFSHLRHTEFEERSIQLQFCNASTLSVVALFRVTVCGRIHAEAVILTRRGRIQ